MSMITKITTYNAPFEIASADRFYKDNDNKLSNYMVLDGPKFSYQFTNSTTMTITITDGGLRASYMRVESDAYPNKPVSYWFLTANSRIESSRANQFTAILDVVATFGEDIFDVLDGQKVKIDRLHEDRYTFDGTNFHMNTAHHALVNSDFKLGDTKGVQLNFDGAVANGGDGKTTLTIGNYYENIFQDPSGKEGIERKNNVDVEIFNGLIIDKKQYYLYALVEYTGSPLILDEREWFPKTDGTQELEFADAVITNDYSAIRRTILMPVNVNISDPNSSLKPINSLGTLSLLQDNKIINIIKLPYKLNSGNKGMQILFDSAGKRYGYGDISNNSGNSSGFISEDFTWTDDTSKFQIQVGGGGTDGDKFKILQELYMFRTVISYTDADIIQIPTSKLSDDNIMDFIARTKTANEMASIVLAGETEKLEIGLLNSDIMPIDLHIHDLVKTIDIPNFYNQADISTFKGSYTINELGLESSLQISPNQFVEWSENTIMSFTTNQGSTYLARNKYTQDAQRKGIDIQKDLAINSASSRAGQYASNALNPVSAIMSLGTSTVANLVGASYAGEEIGLQEKLASNKKSQIQASINDASATAPSLHTGSVHNLANLNTQEFKNTFNWVMKIPNKFLRDKMVNFYDRHGYTFHDWIKFDKDMVENRVKFNYIEMDEFKDFMGTFKNFDINMLNLIDAEFKKGLRLWHQDLIMYNDPNLEIVIEEVINQLGVLKNYLRDTVSITPTNAQMSYYKTTLKNN